jgi:hypothetical protein
MHGVLRERALSCLPAERPAHTLTSMQHCR